MVGQKQARGAGAAEQRDVVVGQVGGVHRAWSAARARPASASSSVGVAPYAARQASFSAGCSDRCTCSGTARGGRRRPSPMLVARHRAHRVDRRADRASPGAGRSASTRSAHALGGAVAEPPLPRVQRRVPVAVEAAGEVAGVEQGDPDARRRAAAWRSASPIAFGSSYGVPPGPWCR